MLVESSHRCGMECETCDKKNGETGDKKRERKRKTRGSRKRGIYCKFLRAEIFVLICFCAICPPIRLILIWYRSIVAVCAQNQFTFLSLFLFSLRHIPIVHTKYCTTAIFGLCSFLACVCVCACVRLLRSAFFFLSSAHYVVCDVRCE